MIGELHIDAIYNCANDGDGTRPIIRWALDAELIFTLKIEGRNSLRKTLSYSLNSMDNDPIQMVDYIVNQKKFSPRLDFFANAEYSLSDITHLKVIWDKDNAFLQFLFSVVKQDKLMEAFG
jgi:hypothetical protein